MDSIKIGKYVVAISNEDRLLFPKSKITKGDIIAYYRDIAPIMLPYIKQRAITMVRCPNGITQECFYQKDAPDYFPDWIERCSIKKEEDGTTQYVVCNTAATVVYLANQACITPHIWSSRIDKIEYPDMMIFDLDPPSENYFEQVRAAAFALKKLLESYNVMPFAKLTGSKGIHVIVPIKRTVHIDTVRSIARAIAEQIVEQSPQILTLEIRKQKRGKRIFVDTVRNAFGHTTAAPYAVRTIEGAPVAAPVTWKELADKKISPQQYTIKNIFKRIDRVGDVWEDMMQSAVSLASLEKKLKK